MSKYINAETLIEMLKAKADMALGTPKAVFGNAIKMIDLLPPADVVEVVRCKDCVYSREMGKYEMEIYLSNCVGCTMHSKSYHDVIMRDDDFCSYGERKESNDR